MSELILDLDAGLPELPKPLEKKQTAGLVVPQGIGDKTFRHVVGAAYTAYIACKGIPSVEEIYSFSDKKVTKQKIAEVTITDEFAEAMQARGVSWRPDDYTGISAAQAYCIQILTNPVHEKKTLGAKLKLAGVTYTQYRAWLKQPTFNRYLNNLVEGMLTDHQGDIHTVVMNKALSGDLAAIKYIDELTGRYDPNHRQVEDLRLIVDKLIEVVTSEVKDQETLTRIANKLSITMTGLSGRKEIRQ